MENMLVLKRSGTSLSLRDKVRAITNTAEARTQCILCDVSGSMADSCAVDGDRTRLDALKDLLTDFPNSRIFCFSGTCWEGLPSQPCDRTDMAAAFEHLKSKSIRHAIIITDGRPDSEQKALQAAQGLKLDIFYVGPPPEPPFLRRLAQMTGGTYGATSLSNTKQLSVQVRMLLKEVNHG